MLEKVLKFFKLSNKIDNTTSICIENNIDNLFEDLNIDTITILIGQDFIMLNDSICENIGLLREFIKEEYGFIFPSIRVKSDFSLQENEMQFYINKNLVHTDFAIPNSNYIDTTFLDILKNIIIDNVDKIFTNEITEKYINYAQRDNLWMVWNLTNKLSTVEIKTILIDLIKNKKSINNINLIFEKICNDIFIENSTNSTNPHKISERLCKIL